MSKLLHQQHYELLVGSFVGDVGGGGITSTCYLEMVSLDEKKNSPGEQESASLSKLL